MNKKPLYLCMKQNRPYLSNDFYNSEIKAIELNDNEIKQIINIIIKKMSLWQKIKLIIKGI